MTGEPRSPRAWSPTDELLVVAGADRAEVADRSERLAAVLRERPATRLRDLACTLVRHRQGAGARLTLVADSVDDAARKLSYAHVCLADSSRERIRDRGGIFFFDEPLRPRGKLALLFPGEGSQYPWMLSELCCRFPEVCRVMDLADRAFAGHPRGYLPSRLIYPRPGDDERRGEDLLFSMDGAVEGVLAADLAMARLLERFGLQPDVIVGHSTGDYAALLTSGALVVEDDEQLIAVVRRLNAVYEAMGRGDGVPRATLLAVGLGRREVLDRLLARRNGALALAIDNCPHQAVVCGSEEEIAAAEAALGKRGAVLERLRFDRPYHTPRFEPVAAPLGELFASLPFAPPSTPLWSAATAAPVPGDADELRELAVAQWTMPVRFRETVEALFDDGVRLFVEAGPRGGLSAFVTDTLRGRPHAAIPADLQRSPGLRQLLHLLAQLVAHGVALDLEPLFARRGCRELDWSEPAPTLSPTVRLDSTLPALRFDGEPPPLDGGSRPLRRPEPAAPGPATDEPEARGPRPPETPGSGLPHHPIDPIDQIGDPVLDAFFRINEMLMESNRRVVLTYLGASQNGRAVAVADAHAAAPLPRPPSDLAAPPDTPEHPEPIAPPDDASSEPVEPPAPPATGPATGVRERLLELVAERTGYPTDLLDLDANLEADLGIDSIKRVEILSALRQSLDSAVPVEELSGLRTLREIAAVLNGAATSDGAPEADAADEANEADARDIPAERPARPLAGTILALEPGKRVVTRRRIDLDEDLWLRDHTLGSQVSERDPELPALPVVMLTMAVEIMAQAASLLAPGAVVAAVRDVRARRFLALHGEHLDVEIEAERAPGPEPAPVSVSLREAITEAGNGSAPHGPILTASVELADRYPEPGARSLPPLRGARPSRFRPEDLYTRVMFHGSRLQGVESVRAWAERGVEIALRALPAGDLFRSVPEPDLLTDPVLLDAAGQAVGFWTAEHLRTGFVVFPFQIDEIALFGPPAAAGERLLCRAAIELSGERLVRADFEVADADDHVHLRVRGWQDKRIPIAEELFRFRFAPGETMLSHPVDDNDPDRGVLLRFTERLMETEGGAWCDGLAHLTLSRRERRAWNALEDGADLRASWLLARVAAKDAVRVYLSGAGNCAPRPADIETEGPPHGVLSARVDGLDNPLEIRVRATPSEAEAVLIRPPERDSPRERRAGPRPAAPPG